MLCPDCHRSAPGGTPCPGCGRVVPDRESMSGQGSRYFVVLVAISLALLVLFLLATTHGGPGPATVLRRSPPAEGSGSPGHLSSHRHRRYYWLMLREEEVIVTDDGIARHCMGDETLRWDEVRAFNRQPILFGRRDWGASGLSRLYAGARAGPAPVCYELVGPPDASGAPRVLLFEPGTIEEMPWLLQLIEEHVGPPVTSRRVGQRRPPAAGAPLAALTMDATPSGVDDVHRHGGQVGQARGCRCHPPSTLPRRGATAPPRPPAAPEPHQGGRPWLHRLDGRLHGKGFLAARSTHTDAIHDGRLGAYVLQRSTRRGRRPPGRC